jgi:hypothetical protein
MTTTEPEHQLLNRRFRVSDCTATAECACGRDFKVTAHFPNAHDGRVYATVRVLDLYHEHVASIEEPDDE